MQEYPESHMANSAKRFCAHPPLNTQVWDPGSSHPAHQTKHSPLFAHGTAYRESRPFQPSNMRAGGPSRILFTLRSTLAAFSLDTLAPVALVHREQDSNRARSRCPLLPEFHVALLPCWLLRWDGTSRELLRTLHYL